MKGLGNLTMTSKASRRGKKKGLISLAMIFISGLVMAIVYKITSKSLVSVAVGSLIFYPIPIYYIQKIRPYRALGASILSPMVAGAIGYIVLYFLDAPIGCLGHQNNTILIYGGLSLITGGLSGFIASSVMWTYIIGSSFHPFTTTTTQLVDLSAIASLFYSFTTTLGIIIARTIRNPHFLRIKTVFLIALGTLLLYVAYVFLNTGYLHSIILVFIPKG